MTDMSFHRERMPPFQAGRDLLPFQVYNRGQTAADAEPGRPRL